jgi:hypothetical protein
MIASTPRVIAIASRIPNPIPIFTPSFIVLSPLSEAILTPMNGDKRLSQDISLKKTGK